MENIILINTDNLLLYLQQQESRKYSIEGNYKNLVVSYDGDKIVSLKFTETMIIEVNKFFIDNKMFVLDEISFAHGKYFLNFIENSGE